MSDFGAQLKDWRQRRRLSQLDLALECGVSARHLSFLETGRSRPSRAMVLTLAEALGAPRTARNGLLTAAGFAAAYGAAPLEAEAMAPVRAALDRLITGHDPYPAMAMDRLWRLVEMNASAARLFGAAGLTPGDSLLEALFDPATRAMIENWAEVGHHALTRIRAESTAAGGVPELDLAASQLAADPDIAAHVPATPLPPVVPTIYRAGDLRLSLFSIFAQFGSAEDIALADLKIELMYPADAGSHAMLEALAG
jgi:transcriptional regulator with XRE-family HTH domain